MSADMKKVVVKVDVHDNKDKKVAMRAVSSLQVDVHDDKDKKKAMKAVSSLQEPKKGEEEKKKDPNEQIAELVKAYKAYNPCMTTYYSVQSAEENPNACVVM
ncbi:heavy metal-associated domain containing protein [Musa troglodytarum]|uniref:Heavy metal-associated domain containing protein n=1 Tax=Musa troglodytarum TaxID=320322 RepID=A0A9E7H2M3_9LILI|nr:heavy metal-associated domain containing protein [Musa troglodytarum]